MRFQGGPGTRSGTGAFRVSGLLEAQVNEAMGCEYLARVRVRRAPFFTDDWWLC